MEDDEVDGFHAAQQGNIDGNAVDGLLRHHDGEKPTDIQMRRSCTSNLRLIWQPARPGTLPSLLYLYDSDFR
jgi:hypothetical protein